MIQIRLANLMGLDINNSQHSVAITEALHGVEDVNMFYDFCNDKKYGIEYTTKPERLMILATRYKKLQDDAKLPIENANNFSRLIVIKVEECKTFIKNQIENGNPRPFSSLRIDGSRYFTDKELKALATLGSSSYIIELTELGELQEKLTEKFLQFYKKKASYTALTDGQKRINKLIGNLS